MSKKPEKNGKAETRKPKDPSERVRKIGEREETIRRELSAGEIQFCREELEALLDEEDNIEAKQKEAAKNFSSQLATNRLHIGELRKRIKAKHVDEKVLVEEHLTHGNEVVRIRKDTGDKIGARTATPKELQEELFQEKPSDSDPAAPVPQDAATGQEGDPFPEDNEFGAEQS